MVRASGRMSMNDLPHDDEAALQPHGAVVPGLGVLSSAQHGARMARPDPALLCVDLPGRRMVLVTGGTGFIGQRLVAALASAGHGVIVLTRDRNKAWPWPQGSVIRIVTRLDAIGPSERIDAIVNLAGEPISDSPWTRSKRQRILRSRLKVTREILRLLARLEHKPMLVSGSAIGWYGLRGDEPLTEASDCRPCFSHDICARWERMASRAEALGVRTVLLRTGLVLDHDGGMLARLLTPFKFGLGGRFGSGAHWMSWIHRDDMVRLIIHTIATPGVKGPLNATAPEPVTNRHLTQALARALHRPALIPIPAWPLRLVLGDFAQELLLSGQRVLPQLALRSGFRFRYVTIETALAEMIGSSGQA
ncbi:MAG: TIGR01777 family oxidoreductase [Sphingomonadales bacterium]|nr:TIGR01777 family oxidoreductase [Sphingomonadales bacterium]MDE2169988.1 TIGR01777 family oxidoreductase [Sphingomonadales bacterium]